MIMVTVDGPAGAGKGTIAGYLASRFCLAHIDSGRLYRKVGIEAHHAGFDLSHLSQAQIASLCHIAKILTLSDLDDPQLKDEVTGGYASKIAVIPTIREAINAWMYDFFTKLPPEFQGIIVDGRDIGTAVFPQAPCKLFITASEEKRLQRRLLQTGESAEAIAKILKERDMRDSTRKSAPLKAPDDAFILDTSNLSIDTACQDASQWVIQCCGALKYPHT